MNAHPKDRSERRKLNETKKRRETFLREALQRQKAEDDAKAKADSERLQEASRGLPPRIAGEPPENYGNRVTL